MKRRYREKRFCPTVCSTGYPNGRIHDFLKGWGTICKDGSILWDWWRPPTKKQASKFKNAQFDKFIFPVIKNLPDKLITDDLVSVQPMK